MKKTILIAVLAAAFLMSALAADKKKITPADNIVTSEDISLLGAHYGSRVGSTQQEPGRQKSGSITSVPSSSHPNSNLVY